MKRALSTAITIAVAAFFIHFILTFHWRAVWSVLVHASVSLVAIAAVANIVSLYAKARGWALLMGDDASDDVRHACDATFVGAATGSFAISVGGEAARIRWLVKRSQRVNTATALRGLVRSRATEITIFALLIIGASVILPHDAWWRVIELCACAVIVLGLVLWRARIRVIEEIDAPPARRIITEFRDAINAPNVGGALLYAVANWIAQWIAFAVSVYSVTGHSSIGFPIAALIIVNVAGAARVVPGNIGVLTASYLLAAHPFHVSAPVAVAASFVLQAVQILPILAVAAVILLLDRRKSATIAGESGTGL